MHYLELDLLSFDTTSSDNTGLILGVSKARNINFSSLNSNDNPFLTFFRNLHLGLFVLMITNLILISINFVLFYSNGMSSEVVLEEAVFEKNPWSPHL